MSDGVLLGQLVVIWWKRWWRKDDDDCITVVARRYGNLISNSHRDSFRFLLRSFLFFAEVFCWNSLFIFFIVNSNFFLFFLSFFFVVFSRRNFTAKEEEDRETSSSSSSSSSLWRERRKIEVLKRVASRSRRCFDALRQHLVSVWTCVQHKSRCALWRKRGDGQRRSTRQQTTFFFFFFFFFLFLSMSVYVDVMNSFFSLFYFFSSSFFVPISVGPI